jgi:serine/threonine-protein kinase RsbW
VEVNQTFCAWTSHTREQLLGGRRFQDLLSAPGRIYHETHFAPLLHMQDEVSEIALEVVQGDGSRLPVLVNARLGRDAEGRPEQVRIAVFKALDRRRYERELLVAQRRERAARDRTERLQRLTSRLAAAADLESIGELLVAEMTQAGLADEEVGARGERGRRQRRDEGEGDGEAPTEPGRVERPGAVSHERSNR